MNYSYKRYWEPSTAQTLASSLAVGAIATTISYPIDFIKTRIQHRAEGLGVRQKNFDAGYNPNREFRLIHQTGRGFKYFFTGIEAALLSRSVYLLTRNTVYKLIYDRLKPFKPSNDLGYREKTIIAGIAGSLAALASNPFEIVMIRQQVDGALQPEARRNYAGVFDGYNKLAAQEGGTLAFFKGAHASVLRSLALNSMLSLPYNYINECFWTTLGDTIWNRPCALVVATTAASIVALPFDNIKTRLQKQLPDPSQNRLNYKGFIDCFEKVCMQENLLGLYAGYYAFWVKTFIYAGSTIVLMDVITERWKRAAGLKEWQI